MPAELERRLKKQAEKKQVQNPDAYVYGTLRKTGWKPSHQKSSSSSSGKKNNLVSKGALQRRLGNSSDKTFKRKIFKRG